MQRVCPQCFGEEFGISGSVTFVGGFYAAPDGEVEFHEDDVLWESQKITFVECHSCGWHTDIPGDQPFDIANFLAPLLDLDKEDLPDEDEVEDAKV